jgi:hypothetical protein
MTDGSNQTAEVFAGSGYYSQSSAAAFFGWLDSNPPQKLHVKWPSRGVTDQPIDAQATTLVLSPPSP